MTMEAETTTRPRTHRLLPWLAAGVGAIAALSVGIYLLFFQTYHYAVVKEGVLYRTGNRSMVQFSTTVREVKPKTVVILVGEPELKEEPFKSEVSYLRKKGIQVEEIPIPFGKGVPSSHDVKRFLSIVREKENQPVLVHCAQGILRTGMMVAAYQQTELGMNAEQAKASVERFERRPDSRPVQIIQKFIDNYDPVTQEVRDGARVAAAEINAAE